MICTSYFLRERNGYKEGKLGEGARTEGAIARDK
jgi:hypothetical protein